MKQNIYDDQKFFEGYSQLRRHESGLNAAVDQPAMRALLPPLANKRVLDLGCGFGKMCRYAIDQGAASVVGVDLSAKMLAKAREDTADARISYVQSALEDLAFAPASFDLVVSSLALHYVERFDLLCANVKSWLVSGGAFVFSVEHPMVTAFPVGSYLDLKGEKLHWPIDDYKHEGIRHTQWFVDDVIKYHRSVETYVNTLIDKGFSIVRLVEPVATAEAIRERPELSEESRRPTFMMMSARS
ncbi:MAG: class I SAM-dependent methyltransferase [Candidatus Binatus sp.]|jgi:SAM-dependent methyltransferase